MERLDNPLEPERPDFHAVADRRGPAREFGRLRGSRLAGFSRRVIPPQLLANRIDRRARFGSRGTGFARGNDEARRRAAFGLSRHAVGPDLQRADDRVDFATGVAQPLVDPLLEPAAERFLAVAQLLLARLHLGRFFRERVALARGEPLLVLERLHVALDLGQVIGELRFAHAAVRRAVSMIDAGNPSRVRNLEREAAAGRAVVQAVGRGERCRIEAESGRRHALGRRRRRT